MAQLEGNQWDSLSTRLASTSGAPPLIYHPCQCRTSVRPVPAPRAKAQAASLLIFALARLLIEPRASPPSSLSFFPSSLPDCSQSSYSAASPPHDLLSPIRMPLASLPCLPQDLLIAKIPTPSLPPTPQTAWLEMQPCALLRFSVYRPQSGWESRREPRLTPLLWNPNTNS